jgi:hypothetical protein
MPMLVRQAHFSARRTASTVKAAPQRLAVDDDRRDFHLSPTSPAIDIGTTFTEVGFDYNGVARPQGAAYDMRAFEVVQ